MDDPRSWIAAARASSSLMSPDTLIRAVWVRHPEIRTCGPRQASKRRHEVDESPESLCFSATGHASTTASSTMPHLRPHNDRLRQRQPPCCRICKPYKLDAGSLLAGIAFAGWPDLTSVEIDFAIDFHCSFSLNSTVLYRMYRSPLVFTRSSLTDFDTRSTYSR